MSWKKIKKNPFVKAGLVGGALTAGTILSGGTLPVAAAIGLGGAGIYQQYKNYDEQRKQNERQWESYQTQLQREDTSVSRRVEDLKAAGLSPVLAAGSGATSSAVFGGKAPEMQNPIEPIAGVLGLLKMKEDISNTLAQRKLIEKQTALADASQAIKWHDYKIFAESGQPSNGSSLTKTIRDAINYFTSDQVDNIKNELKNKADSLINPQPFKPNSTFDQYGNPIRQPWMDDETWNAVKNIKQKRGKK